MKKISGVTGIIWAIFLLGYCFFPELVKQDAIQFPLALLLSIFLPVSFWQVANQEKKKYLALLFIGMFLVNISFLLVIIRGSLVMQQQISEEVNRGIQQELAEYLVTAVSGNKRRIAARLIYQRHGVVLPFKNESDIYTLYVPSKADKKTFQKNFFARNDLKLQSRGLAASFSTALLLLMIHAGLFIGLLVFLILYDKREGEG
ncbi:hypothetical protein H206_00587 [Candidatus Electrothrix aarhusensis]|jgi:hypothetical protein|uniref:Uncharacterized protein n=1 Tax=Candidatus Electrothrix aarhusensis TaxID=1859131 RepID=A0A3S3U3X1_9BACT|nr:hypothetical protein H206_00587 [Candidatus Electrothrix aarhusensis]